MSVEMGIEVGKDKMGMTRFSHTNMDFVEIPNSISM